MSRSDQENQSSISFQENSGAKIKSLKKTSDRGFQSHENSTPTIIKYTKSKGGTNPTTPADTIKSDDETSLIKTDSSYESSNSNYSCVHV